MNYQQYIPLIVEELKKAEPEKIILFGSYAYGQPNEDSDIDLFVIKDLPATKVRDYRLMLKKALWNLFKDQKIEFDLLVDNQERINQRIKLGDRFYEEIITKGKVFYSDKCRERALLFYDRKTSFKKYISLYEQLLSNKNKQNNGI